MVNSDNIENENIDKELQKINKVTRLTSENTNLKKELTKIKKNNSELENLISELKKENVKSKNRFDSIINKKDDENELLKNEKEYLLLKSSYLTKVLFYLEELGLKLNENDEFKLDTENNLLDEKSIQFLIENLEKIKKDKDFLVDPSNNLIGLQKRNDILEKEIIDFYKLSEQHQKENKEYYFEKNDLKFKLNSLNSENEKIKKENEKIKKENEKIKKELSIKKRKNFFKIFVIQALILFAFSLLISFMVSEGYYESRINLLEKENADLRSNGYKAVGKVISIEKELSGTNLTYQNKWNNEKFKIKNYSLLTEDTINLNDRIYVYFFQKEDTIIFTKIEKIKTKPQY